MSLEPAHGEVGAAGSGWSSARTRALYVLLGVLLDQLWLAPGLLGVHLPWLVFVADAPFLLLLWQGDQRRWKRWALLYGLAHFASMLNWLSQVGWLQYLGAAAVLGPIYVLLGLVLRWGAARRLPFVPLVGLGVVLEELVRTVWMGGMPWPQRSLAFVGWDTLRAGAALAGAYGLTFLAGMTSALAVGLVGVVRAHPSHQGRLAPRWLLAGLAPAAWAGLVLLHGQGRLERQETAVLSGRAGRLAPLLAVQGSIPQSLKHSPSADTANEIFNRHTTITEVGLAEAAEARTRVSGVLWAETMVPWPFVSPALARRFPEAWRNQNVILSRLKETVPTGTWSPTFFVGAIHHEESAPGEVHERVEDYLDYDSLIALDVRAAPTRGADPVPPPEPGDPSPAWLLGRHDKVVRVPGGEYTPLGDWIPLLRVFRDHLGQVPEIAAGADDQEPFLLGAWSSTDPGGRQTSHAVRAGTVICFEIAFPARCRAWRRAGCQVLFNAANYGWFGETSFRPQICAVAALRAAELGQTVVMAGNTGPTAFFDPVGAAYGRFVEVALTPQGLLDPAGGGRGREVSAPAGSDPTTFRTGYVLDQVVADDTLTLYAGWGDWPWAALALTFLLGALMRRGPPSGAGRGASGPR